MSDFSRSSLIDAILAHNHGPSGPMAKDLVPIFVGGLDEEEIALAEPETIAAVATGLAELVAKRPPGTARLRVFDPDPERDGWTSPHTVIQIINDDMPFLVDSVSMELARQGLAAHVLVHPVLAVERDEQGKLAAIGRGDGHESLMHLEIDRQPRHRHADLVADLTAVLDDVRASVIDWPVMRRRLADLGEAGFKAEPEAQAFLQWLYEDKFIFLGYRHFTLWSVEGAPEVTAVAESGLGLLRDPERHAFSDEVALADMPADIRAFLTRPEPLLVTKSGRRSTVHRSALLDIVGLKDYGADGRLVGLHVFLGLFTAEAYTGALETIPVLRAKTKAVIERAGFPRFGHDAKVLGNVLGTFPRDELFQIDNDLLYTMALGICRLQERPRPALFVRRDDFGRFVSCQIFLPRDRYDTPLRQTVTELVERAFGGVLDTYAIQVADGPLARLHLLVRTPQGAARDVDLHDLESRITEVARAWPEQVQAALIRAHGESRGLILARRWRDAFPASYRERHSPLGAATDAARLDQLLIDGGFSLHAYRPLSAADSEARIKLLSPDHPAALSDMLPYLEAMGLRVIAEVPHQIRPVDGTAAPWVQDFQVQIQGEIPPDLDSRRGVFEEALAAVWRGEAESDGLNRLVLAAGLSWRQVTVLRAYARYLRQVGFGFSPTYVEQAMARNPAVATALIALFEARFDPQAPAGAETAAGADVLAALESVSSADDDRILRRFLNLIQSTLRTNAYRPDRRSLAFKFDSRAIVGLPAPRPLVEIWVHSPRVEAVHLRGGKVARGGLRWSDRPEDFRTEILGLMKAQMVKNAVIVPVGAKGGFVVRHPPAAPAAARAEGVACYQIMIHALLDLTDNLDGASVVAPHAVRRHDGDDPYLVVAADKGTATFSDIANAIAVERGFWLGDAFASGGSKGYDHKAMGITARGAWEAVKRHFREVGIDCQRQDIQVIGVGDMSGDVFGNAMLCSRHIRLIAAFNHSHIFLDPDPDPERSWQERQRLFAAVKSWPDYDPALISQGGGVYSRAAKQIPLAPSVRARLGISEESLTPADLIRRLVVAQADLLFFGGIGTYVKAQGESQADAGDRANDAVRIDGGQLRVKVVGEGANLAMTQRGRVEAALAGIRLNTDAIDNSAGVDTSDHEVNIKILLDGRVAAGELTPRQRDEQLAAMTDEIATLVLRDNYLQTQALSMMEGQSADLLDGHIRFMRLLEKAGRLDRAVEYLPDDETLAERAAEHRGLTRPELAVLLAYAKIWLYDAILASGLPDESHLQSELVRYFPEPLRERFAAAIREHRLRREIIATVVTNSMINRVGIAFVADMMEKSGQSAADVARAYLVTRDAFALRDVWTAIEGLDGQVPAAVQAGMLVESNRLLVRATAGVLRAMVPPFDVAATNAELRPAIQALEAALLDVMPAETAETVGARSRDYQAQGVPEPLARRVSILIVLAAAADILRIVVRHGLPVAEAGRLYFAVGQRFALGWLRATAHRLGTGGYWPRRAAEAAIEDLYGHQRDLAAQVAATASGLSASEALARWIARRKDVADRTDALLGEIRAAQTQDLAMIAVANRQLRAMSEARPQEGS